MELKEQIFRRKAVRKYSRTPLSPEQLDIIRTFIAGLKPLFPDIRTEIRISNRARNSLGPSAPHYVHFYSEHRDGYAENIGFMGQQISLYLTSLGLGSCWLGSALPDENKTRLRYCITLAFGAAEEDVYRKPDAFRRKPLSQISEGTDSRLEAARVAPSGVNSQNWYFVCSEGRIDVYRKKVNPVQGVVYNKMNSVDVGIALCHIWLCSESFSYSLQEHPEKKGYIYMGTVNGR